MAFANINEISKKRVSKFLEMLRQQPLPSIFADCTPETWAELDQNLAQLGDEDYKKMAGVILAWLDKHHYAPIKVALQTVKKDPDNEPPHPPSESEQPIRNTALRSAIKDAQSKSQQPS